MALALVPAVGCVEGAEPVAAEAVQAALTCSTARTATYDQVVACDAPVALWSMSSTSSTESDLTGHGHTGGYHGGSRTRVALPNGELAGNLNGSSQYLSVPSSSAFSIPTTGSLTWEAWIRPAVLDFPHASDNGYVDWMGKCEEYSPTCEWQARMYKTHNEEDRCNRISAYVFNSSAGLGSAGDWQPECGLIQANQWLHVVGSYTTTKTPSGCPRGSRYPGQIDIWVNGVKWSQPDHHPTGCMSQYRVTPQANDSALNIGTMAMESWFKGAIGKVAIYDHLLTSAQITAHYQKMTGRAPTGSCGDDCTF